MKPPAALSVAGSDPSGGAGVQSDLKTFLDHGVYGMAVITAITVQDSTGVHACAPVEPGLLRAQLDAVLRDIPPAAIKVGMLATARAVLDLAERLGDCPCPVVVDPVLRSSSGARLMEPEGIEPLGRRLAPRATLLTPNLPELEELGGEAWARSCGSAVLVTGGHAPGDRVVDRLLLPSGAERSFSHPRVATGCDHGTGCALSAAVAARLARGEELEAAVEGALAYVRELLLRSRGLGLGRGRGPMVHAGLRSAAPAFAGSRGAG